MTLSPFRNTALLYGRCWRRCVPAARLAGPGGTSLYQGTLPPRNSKPQVTGHFHADHLGRASAPTVSSASTEPPAAEPRRPFRAHDNTCAGRGTQTPRPPGGGPGPREKNPVPPPAPGAPPSRSATPAG